MAGRITRRRWLCACLALAVAVLGVVGFLAWGVDTQVAARRRVPLGADEDAVAAAVGRPADAGVIGRGSRVPERVQRELL
jgi:hypothetical protein